LPARQREIDAAALQPFTKLTMSFLRIDSFVGAEVLARADGVFVLKLKVRAGFDPELLNELALAASMAAKAKLGHQHDVHGGRSQETLPGSKRAGKSAGEVLIVEPVQLLCDGWEERFQRQSFGDDDLRRAKAVRAELEAGEEPRNALICLRRKYLRVFELLQIRLQSDRDEQVTWQRSPGLWAPSVAGFTLVTLLVLYVAFIGLSPALQFLRTVRPETLLSAEFILPTLEFAGSVIVLGLTTALFWFQLLQLLRWDRHRIRWLRLSEMFYHYANPLNDVIRRIMNGRRVLAPGVRVGRSMDAVAVTDFAALIGILQTKAAGEVHRHGLRQFWVTLTVAVVAIYFAAFAIRDSTVRASMAPPGISLATLDCGGAQPRAVGPFDLGAWDSLSPDGRTTDDVLRSVQRELDGRKPRTFVLFGSADGTAVRTGSALPSNGELARRRRQNVPHWNGHER